MTNVTRRGLERDVIDNVPALAYVWSTNTSA